MQETQKICRRGKNKQQRDQVRTGRKTNKKKRSRKHSRTACLRGTSQLHDALANRKNYPSQRVTTGRKSWKKRGRFTTKKREKYGRRRTMKTTNKEGTSASLAEGAFQLKGKRVHHPVRNKVKFPFCEKKGVGFRKNMNKPIKKTQRRGRTVLVKSDILRQKPGGLRAEGSLAAWQENHLRK